MAIRVSKQLQQQIIKADKEIKQESLKQFDILYHATALALFRFHGFTTDDIHNIVKLSDSTYEDCVGGEDLSMLELLWNETGIELMRDDGEQRWFECKYLNSELDDGKNMNGYEILQMLRNEKKWVAAQIQGSILLTLHRNGWGDKALGKIFNEIEDIKHEYKLNPDKLREVCWEETGFQLAENFDKFALRKEK